MFKSIAVFAAICVAASAQAQRPNFVVINVDDLGYADIGPYGSTTPTPNLDRMATEGRKLTSHYAAPVCSPSRAALMTGCYPKRALPIPHVLFPVAEVGLNPNEVTVAEVLKQAGYATACIGKWHLGDQREFLPTNQGFDSYFGIPYSNDMGPASDGSKSNPGKPLPAAKNPGEPQRDENGVRGNTQPPLPLLENDKVVARIRAEDQFKLVQQYTDRAVKFIHENAERPFFLYIPHTAVHFPHYPSEKFMGKSPNRLLGDWAQEVDASVGRVLETLRELKLDRNTLVIFTSDNGGSLPHGSNNGPLRGSKGSTFEGGIRVCTIAWWPGRIPAGTSTGCITSMMDVLPTFATLAGAQLPNDRKLDGVDVSPALFGDPETPPRSEFCYYRGFALEAVRSGPWKLHLSLADGPPNAKKAPARPQLFNLDNDLGEKHDVAMEHSEIVARLQTIAQKMTDDLGSPTLGPGCRPLGRVVNPEPLIASDGKVRADAVGSTKLFP